MRAPKSPLPSQEAWKILCSEYIVLAEELLYLREVKVPLNASRYHELLGKWQILVMEMEIEARLWHERLEAGQKALNMGLNPKREDIITDATEEVIGDLLALEMKRVDAEQYKKAAARLEPLLEQDQAALRDLYRHQAMALDPDINTGLTENHAALWLEMQSAYRHNNLNRLRALAVLQSQLPPLGARVAPGNEAKAVLEALVRQAVAQIEKLNAQFPLNVLAKMENAYWVKSEQNRLHSRLGELVKLAAHRRAAFEMLDFEEDIREEDEDDF